MQDPKINQSAHSLTLPIIVYFGFLFLEQSSWGEWAHFSKKCSLGEEKFERAHFDAVEKKGKS